ncbi:ribosomal protein S18-alanine N-acetyltransferase [candidate division NPL-UPA2 bacterium]|nr:ribosomal protein S18-alanine N-acetyltransferase [candidate division NPL-UPA2 bacterium]
MGREKTAEEISIDGMREEDLNEIMEIEKVSFPSPWTKAQFSQELEAGSFSHFLVAKREGRVVGYSGFFLVADEAHIGNLAVHPRFRRRKVGERLVAAMLERARAKGARRVALEVRAGNTAAQKLYQKLGFARVATRPGYYMLTQEDAIIMHLDLQG